VAAIFVSTKNGSGEVIAAVVMVIVMVVVMVIVMVIVMVVVMVIVIVMVMVIVGPPTSEHFASDCSIRQRESGHV
jgi:ABC-type bacteriocin/lantibiotic exporter with double-glycine peptidase domain